jgi:hypothetical protein
MIKNVELTTKYITGKTTINHRVATELKISLDQYCLLELIEKCEARREHFTMDLCYKRLGFQSGKVLKELTDLRILGFVEKRANNTPKVTLLWRNAFELNPNEFEIFWNKDGKCCWPGSSKKDAFSKYTAARKLYSAEYLLSQRNNYLNYLLVTNRYIMGCSVFLGLEKENFNIDWKINKDQKQEVKQEKREYSELF